MKEFLFGAAGIVLAGAALAQTQPAPVPAVPQASPLHLDRVQTRDQVVGKVREHFAQLDTNKDGFLTKEEAEAGRALMKKRIKDRFVEGGTQRMAKPDSGAAFERLDTNKDGTISREEFAKGHEMRMERRMVMGGPGGHKGMRMHRFGMMGGNMFDMADANKDGRVSLQEATEAAVKHFDMADANRDGQVTPDERRQMHRQMMEKHHPPKAG